MRLDTLFNDYAAHHKTRGNQITHLVGIPMITVAVLGLLANLVLGDGLTGSEFLRADGGMILGVVAFLWYFFLDWKLAVPFGVFSLGLYFFGRALPVPVLGAMFVVGWAFQLYGHFAFEKKKPALFKNLVHLLIGPLWIFAKIIRYGV